MAMSRANIRGDFSALAKLQAKVKKLASNDRQLGLSNVVGAAMLAELQLGFRSSTDPYGNPWAPLKLRTGGKPLLDTGRLRSSFSYQPSRSVVRIGTNFIGARVHQYGATITPKNGRFLVFRGKKQTRRRSFTPWIFATKVVIPRRQMVPEGSLGNWREPMEAAATRFLSRIMKG
jgi:phage gpG-like protein